MVAKRSVVQKIKDRNYVKTFSNFTVALTLNITIHFFTKTPQLAVRYHPIKPGQKKISNAAEMVETYIHLTI